MADSINQSIENEDRLSDRYARFVIKFRLPIILALLIATIIAATQIHKLDIRNDPDTLLPPSNRYVATNLYAEHNFGMGNLMVFSLRVKEGDIYQPWFVNKVQELHRKLEELPNSRPANFINFAAQKIKYMGADENGLVFKRLIPTEGISETDPELAKEQLAFLKEGIKTNPVMAPMMSQSNIRSSQRRGYNGPTKKLRIIGSQDTSLMFCFDLAASSKSLRR